MSDHPAPPLYAALRRQLHGLALHRPLRLERYDPGTQLSYEVTPVDRLPDGPLPRVHLRVERFVGGGFAGQVYRTVVTGIENGPVGTLTGGSVCAMKILIPPASGALMFRNLVYAVGFQGPFQLQVNPAAARAGALWQRLIRRGARVRFGDENCVNDVHATFVDTALGSCGELSDWIDGRTWLLEVDDHMDELDRWRRGKPADPARLGSPEYRAKHEFMHSFVDLLHDMGAHEFARQYAWSTCKSQPNCLKRTDTDTDPRAGLVAVDFRAGLALLPVLPMSPGDVGLIARGLQRGSLVQFDRGDLSRLQCFVSEHHAEFDGLHHLLPELEAAEQQYRASLPDITHHGLRVLSPGLWRTILDAAVTGWSIRGSIDATGQDRLRRSRRAALVFLLLGLVPVLGRIVRKLWCHNRWRAHYRAMLTDAGYLGRALRGRAAEQAVSWHRAGRIEEAQATRIAASPLRYLLHLPCSLLPAGLHRICTNPAIARDMLAYYLVRPVRLYFDGDLREQWLHEMVAEGRRKRLITNEDARIIVGQIKEPFIQKYLKSLAVHVCTLPVTQVVSVLLAITYVLLHPEMPRAQAWAVGLGIIALFQVTPISPGSLVRGLYVVYLVVRERNVRDYNIAVFLGFFKYVGYLAFPIQMTYRYPALARFMAAHWATDAVHIVPVFGEQGALLEHSVFCWFYNWPLTIRRRVRAHMARWEQMPPRFWHIPLIAAGAALLLTGVEAAWATATGQVPVLRDIWWAVALLAPAAGAAVMRGCGGAALGRRVVAATLCGAGAGVLACGLHALLPGAGGTADLLIAGAWRVFVFSVLAPIGALLALIRLTDPERNRS